MFCPKCGKEISDESDFCNFCGYEIDPNISAINSSAEEDVKEEILKKHINEYPKDVNKKKFKKLIAVLLVCSVLIISLSLVYLLPVNSKVESGYFQDTKWGMSLEEVKKTLPETIEEKVLSEDMIVLYVDIKEYDIPVLKGLSAGAISYTFKEDLLTLVTVLTAIRSDEAEDYENAIITDFNQKYGEYSISNNGFYEWQSEKSSITMIVGDDISYGVASIRDLTILFVDNSKQ